jgi:hypothetical protein
MTGGGAHVSSDDLEKLPARWRPIAAQAEPRARVAAALALWNAPLLDALPQFAVALRSRFTDVRPCVVDDEPALSYQATHADGHPVTWLGLDPGGFAEPPFWDRFPPPLQDFLHGVHDGFTSGGRDSFGPMPPRLMQTIAEQAGEPGGLEDWDSEQDIVSTRLVVVTTNGGPVDYCVSPDLDPGELAVVYEGDIDPTPYGTALDALLMRRLDR